MNSKLKNAAVLGAVVLGSVGFIEIASAETLSGVADRLTEQFSSFAKFLVGGSFIAGAGTGIMSIAKFKEHADNPGQSKLSKPIGYLLASAALIGVPTWLSTSTNTLTGESHESADSTGGGYDAIK